jgi:transposase
VLLAADVVGTNEIVHRVGVSKPAVIRWKRRYAAEGVAGLDDRAKSGRPLSIDPMRIVLASAQAGSNQADEVVTVERQSLMACSAEGPGADLARRSPEVV